jgi:hypothetical protein
MHAVADVNVRMLAGLILLKKKFRFNKVAKAMEAGSDAELFCPFG